MIIKRPKQIFIVEDDEIYPMMLDYILSKDSSYQFLNFTSGEECLFNLYLNPDVIILDHELPGINGYNTLLEIKKYNPVTHVVFLSNDNNKELRERILKAGADDYLLKQAHGEKEMIDKIDEILIKDELKKKSRRGMFNSAFIEKIFSF
jgi:CheY-like chemotaxis protein